MVDDEIYLASLSRAVTREETWLRDVLVFHRCYLNGGLCHAIEIQADSLASVLDGYEAFGLTEFAKLVRIVAAQTCGDDVCTCQDFSAQYSQMTYGVGGDKADAVEAVVAERLKLTPQLFSNLVEA